METIAMDAVESLTAEDIRNNKRVRRRIAWMTAVINRQLRGEKCEKPDASGVKQLEETKAKLSRLAVQARLGVAGDFGLETFCGCPAHIKYLGHEGIFSLQDLAQADLFAIRRALWAAEHMEMPQWHLRALLDSRRLLRLSCKRDKEFQKRESQRF